MRFPSSFMITGSSIWLDTNEDEGEAESEEESEWEDAEKMRSAEDAPA